MRDSDSVAGWGLYGLHLGGLNIFGATADQNADSGLLSLFLGQPIHSPPFHPYANTTMSQQHDPAALLDQAQQALTQTQPELAKKFLLRILETHSTYPDALEAMGVAEMEAANIAAESAEDPDQQAAIAGEAAQRAREWFLKAVQVQPDLGCDKFWYLGQLSGGKEAVEYYRRGVQVGEKEVGLLADHPEEVNS